MKFTLPWLKEHLETDASLEAITEKLTMLGLEVEEVSDPGAGWPRSASAYVREARQHPNADRLRLCTVETRHGVFEVVCGAPNARTGMKAVFAPEGSVIPASGRGPEEGGDPRRAQRRHAVLGARARARRRPRGIIELPATSRSACPRPRALGLEGPVIEVKLTPDRSDCFGVAGIARDLAAAGLGRLEPRLHARAAARPGRDRIGLDFPRGEEAACPLFVGRMIRGVRNGPSPAWLQNRLKAIGLRPISALVDITNYLTFDLCRPLHVFDAGKVRGDLTLRFARLGEELLALDGKTYRLDDGMTVIADASGADQPRRHHGRREHRCHRRDHRRAARGRAVRSLAHRRDRPRLGIESDARTRFERGLDPELVLPGVEFATRLILELCGGEPGEVVVAGAVPGRPARGPLPQGAAAAARRDRPRHGRDRAHPAAPGLRARGRPRGVAGHAALLAPRHLDRGLHRRGAGAAARLRPDPAGAGDPDRGRARRADRRAAPARRGAPGGGRSGLRRGGDLVVRPARAGRLFGAAQPILKRNPLNAELSAMRPSLLPNLLAAAARNLARKHEAGALFEARPPLHRRHARRAGGGALRPALRRRRAAAWAHRNRPVDALDAKADALAALAVPGIKPETVQVTTDAPPGTTRAARAAAPGPAGAGELRRAAPRRQGVRRGGDLWPRSSSTSTPCPSRRRAPARPSPLEPLPYPPVDRDFAFVVDGALCRRRLLEAVRGVDRRLIREVRLFDV